MSKSTDEFKEKKELISNKNISEYLKEQYLGKEAVAIIAAAKKHKKLKKGAPLNLFVLDRGKNTEEDELLKFLDNLKNNINDIDDGTRFQLAIQNGRHWTACDVLIENSSPHIFILDAAYVFPAINAITSAFIQKFPETKTYVYTPDDIIGGYEIFIMDSRENKSSQELRPGILYLEKEGNGKNVCLRYTVIDPTKEIVTDTIIPENLPKLENAIKEGLNIKTLKPLLSDILNITTLKGHTEPKARRIQFDDSNCSIFSLNHLFHLSNIDVFKILRDAKLQGTKYAPNSYFKITAESCPTELAFIFTTTQSWDVIKSLSSNLLEKVVNKKGYGETLLELSHKNSEEKKNAHGNTKLVNTGINMKRQGFIKEATLFIQSHNEEEIDAILSSRTGEQFITDKATRATALEADLKILDKSKTLYYILEKLTQEIFSHIRENKNMIGYIVQSDLRTLIDLKNEITTNSNFEYAEVLINQAEERLTDLTKNFLNNVISSLKNETTISTTDLLKNYKEQLQILITKELPKASTLETIKTLSTYLITLENNQKKSSIFSMFANPDKQQINTVKEFLSYLKGEKNNLSLNLINNLTQGKLGEIYDMWKKYHPNEIKTEKKFTK